MNMRSVIIASLVMCVATGFAPSPKLVVRPNTNNVGHTSRLFAAKAADPGLSPLKKVTAPFDSLINKLPWNARRIEVRRARKIRRDIADLHRQMGIPEDAPYEDLQAATDRLIREAGKDVKKRLKVEKSKDDILLLRLSERVAGLTSISTDAKAQSTYEKDGASEAKEVEKKNRPVPQWRDGLIVKPDEKWIKRTAAIWSIFTIIPFINDTGSTQFLSVFQFVFLTGQLMWRGVPKDMHSGGTFRRPASTVSFAHQKVAWLLSLGIFCGAKLLAFSLVPPAIRKSLRATALWSWTLECGMFAASNLYLQPYKPQKYKKDKDLD